jgi:hypothetical protein
MTVSQFNVSAMTHAAVAFLIVATLSTTAFSQSDAKALVDGLVKAHADEFKPLKAEKSTVEQQFSSRRYAIQRIIYWLKENPKTANAKRLQEIAELEARLAELKSNAELTSPEGIGDLKSTVETANITIEDINDERTIALKPLKRKLSALQRKYEDQEEDLEPFIEGLFRESGIDSASELKRSYASFNYSSGSASGNFKKDGDKKTVCTCMIYLADDKPAKKELGKLNDKYPICYAAKTQMEIRVGNARVTIYSSNSKYNDKAIGTTLSDVVDLEKLASLVGE